MVFDAEFVLADYMDIDRLKKYIYDKFPNSKFNDIKAANDYRIGAYGEFAFACWLKETWLYPDILPNEDLYKTDLNYKKINPKLTNFHVKTTDWYGLTISGLISIKNKSGNDNKEPLICDPLVIENDAIGLIRYDVKTSKVLIHSTIPARIVTRDGLWKAPIKPEWASTKSAVYAKDVENHPEVIRMNDLSSKKESTHKKEPVREKPTMASFYKS